LNFYYWKNEDGDNDLIFLVGDGQAQTIDGQYDVATRIISFAKAHGVEIVIAVGGYSNHSIEDDRKVFSITTSEGLLKRFGAAGATPSPPGNPVVGIAGLLIGLAKMNDMDAVSLLGETLGYLPDMKASRDVLTVLKKAIKIRLSLDKLEEEKDRFKGFLKEVERIGERAISYEERSRQVEKLRTTYIS
jgi:proteasome assembly chaperone (PAC2) family protein